MSLPLVMTFVRFVEGVLCLRLTTAQRVLCRVAFDDVDPDQLDGEEREIARLMFAVDAFPPLARRLCVLRLGRGSGKTTLAAAYALFVMLFMDVRSCGPGDVPAAVVVAPTKRTAGISLRMGRELVRGVPALDRLVDSESTEGFALRRPTDGRLVQFVVFAASRGGSSARGLTVLTFILDEAEFFTSAEDFAIKDHDVFRGLIPRLKGKGVLIGTPWPVPTLMGELFDQNFGNPTTAVAAKAPSLLMRPDDLDLAATVAMEQERSPEDCRREFFCDMTGMSGSSLLFDAAAIDACRDDTIVMPASAPYGSRLGAGVDLGLTRDAAAMLVAAELDGIVRFLACIELRPQKNAPLKLSEVIATFAETTEKYRLERWCADAFAREPAREYTDRRGIRIHPAPTEQTARTDTWLHAKMLTMERRLRLPPYPCPLAGQLKSVIVKPTQGGAIAVLLPRRRDIGRHGDVAAAAILAIHECNAPRLPRGMGQNQILAM